MINLYALTQEELHQFIRKNEYNANMKREIQEAKAILFNWDDLENQDD